MASLVLLFSPSVPTFEDQIRPLSNSCRFSPRPLFFPLFSISFFTGHTTKTSIGKQTKKKMELSSANQRKIFEVGSFAAVASISANLEAPFSHYGVNSLLPRSCSMAVVPERGRSRFFFVWVPLCNRFFGIEKKKTTNS